MGDIRENVIAVLTNEYLQSKVKTDYFSEYFASGRTFQIFGHTKGKNVSEIVSHINRCLNTNKSRVEGLLLLHHVIQQCDTDLFVDNAESWCKALLQILQSYADPFIHQIVSSELSEILRHSAVFSELSRTIASLIPTLVPVLLNDSKEWEASALNCLKTCLTCYSGPCGPFKNKIEAKLVQLLETVGQNEVFTTQVCECYAQLSHCGGGGQKGGKWAEGWCLYVDKVIGGLHNTLDMLYQDLETDGESYLRPQVCLTLGSTPEGEPNQTLSLLGAYKLLSQLLHTMLRQDLPVCVAVPVESILAVICRAMAMAPKFLLTRPTHDRIVLCSVLPAIHQMSLLLLESLVICVEGGLLPHSATISKVFVQLLNYYLPGDHSTVRKPFSEIRTTVYKVIKTWLVVNGAASAMETVANDIVTHAVSDAKPCSETHKVATVNKVQGTSEQTWSKKKKKKSSSSYTETSQSSWQHKTDPTANVDLCVNALLALSTLVERCGSSLRADHHKTLQEFTVPLLLEQTPNNLNLQPPYNQSPCRAAIYRLLQALILSPCPTWPPPTHLAMKIFSLGQTMEHNLEVKSTCQTALLICQTVIHPRVPPLTSPLSISSSNTCVIKLSHDQPGEDRANDKSVYNSVATGDGVQIDRANVIVNEAGDHTSEMMVDEDGDGDEQDDGDEEEMEGVVDDEGVVDVSSDDSDVVITGKSHQDPEEDDDDDDDDDDDEVDDEVDDGTGANNDDEDEEWTDVDGDENDDEDEDLDEAKETGVGDKSVTLVDSSSNDSDIIVSSKHHDQSDEGDTNPQDSSQSDKPNHTKSAQSSDCQSELPVGEAGNALTDKLDSSISNSNGVTENSDLKESEQSPASKIASKRKLFNNNDGSDSKIGEPDAKKLADETDHMLESFVDAGPDSD